MKLFYPLLILFLGLLFWSCSKDVEPETRKCGSRYSQQNVVLPTKKAFDIDQDGKNDFVIDVEQMSGDRYGSPGVSWHTLTMKQSSFGYQLEEHNLIAGFDDRTNAYEQIWFPKGYVLYRDSLDTTFSLQYDKPLKIINREIALMIRHSCFSDSRYFEESWNIQSDNDAVVDGSGEVYMASYNVATGSLGWIKFQLDMNLGTLIYMEHKYTDANSLIVGD